MKSRPKAGLFEESVIVLLLITALLKIVSAFGHARILRAADPVLLVSNKAALLFAATLEISVVAALIAIRQRWLRLACICALASNFVLY